MKRKRSRDWERDDRKRNPEKYRAWARAANKRLTNFANSCKVSCTRCGITDKRVLEFHHIDPKQKLFSIGNRSGTIGMERLRKEIAKCIVLCANCHKIIGSKILGA